MLALTVAYSGKDAPLGTVAVLARKPLCATRSTETRVWYFVPWLNV
jgi:hypothetical protein